MPQNKIAFYYQQLTQQINSTDDIAALINLHIESFERHGWTVVLADETHARRHPDYKMFDDPTSILSRSRNPWEYTRACYMRWLAYATLGYPYADFDVINYGFTPSDAEDVEALNSQNQPIFLSGTGAMGLLNSNHYDQVVLTYTDFISEPIIAGPLLQDINDMTIMRHLRPKWYDCIPYSDPRFCKDYLAEGWASADLVHYTYGSTGSPRVDVIKSARAPVPADRTASYLSNGGPV